jgi:hypothetical protein
MIALKFSFDVIAVEAADHVPAPQANRLASASQSELSPAATRDANAQPVWIAPTPKYQYDPKLMEVKPPRQLQKEAELRRNQEFAKHQARQREAKARQGHIAEAARKALASANEPASPPAFLMFSPN